MPRLGTVSGHGKPLQPALPGRRAGADSHLQTNGCVTHTVQPLAAGHLTRPEWTTDTLRSRTDRVAMGKYDRTKEQDLEIVHRVHTLAERYVVKMQQIALAWHWAKGVASPIIGATKAAHFDDASAALNVRRRMWPIWSSRICPTRSWAPSTRTRQRALFCWAKRNKPPAFRNTKQKNTVVHRPVEPAFVPRCFLGSGHFSSAAR